MKNCSFFRNRLVQNAGMDVYQGRHIEFDELVSNPVYRVHFWTIRAELGPSLDSFILEGAVDVQEAIDWATNNRENRPWELFARIDVHRSLSSEPEDWWIRLHGESPLVPA
jgi:hypothetical protein